MFSKVLIANRGAIACRIIRTLREMGIGSVVVYSDADRDSLHVSRADQAICLGEGPARETYLDQEKLFRICALHDVQAIHPGYGFLSENPEFVEACEARGIAFLGPRAEQMRAFGLKHSAREIARKNQVPLLPGSGLLGNLDEALREAQRIGYPVMLKSTAGGGGIGMELCYNDDELTAGFASVQRLSQNNFGNADVFLEKFIERARHIEVQVFGDGNGEVIALGERDCSTQRRNQKVVEEAPAPNLPHFVRQELHQTAVRLCQAVDYRNAGTVEFIYDASAAQFYFLEVNTRLQVEHGVTEQVYGVDLVRWMVLLGALELPSLSDLQRTLTPKGHSIQMRLYAEDPAKSFQPCAGLISHLHWPADDTDHLRIDHWIEAGVEVSPFFDPMLAKIIVTDDNRERAIARLGKVLDETEVYGIQTNLDYVRKVLHDPLFIKGEMYTRYLNELPYRARTLEVITAGTMSTVQDWPGRTGFWDVGVPPSGPFDSYSFRLANRLLGNEEHAAGIEVTLTGPTLLFNVSCQLVLCGANLPALVVQQDGTERAIDYYQPFEVRGGDRLRIGKAPGAGARAYLAVAGGIYCPDYLGSKSTFTLGRFGGHQGRALRPGDVLQIGDAGSVSYQALPPELLPEIGNEWQLRVIYGPHAAPEFLTAQDAETFFAANWEVHYNSSRTGVRLIGPKPEWARTDGGEAGMHPSNIHDNAYAIGSVDFTGDMPVILGPDGPSLGGFVCPATVITADLWKLGQLKAGDTVHFLPVSLATAVRLENQQNRNLASLSHKPCPAEISPPDNTVLHRQQGVDGNPEVVGNSHRAFAPCRFIMTASAWQFPNCWIICRWRRRRFPTWKTWTLNPGLCICR